MIKFIDLQGYDHNNLSEYSTFDEFVGVMRSNKGKIKLLYDLETAPAPIEVIKSLYDEDSVTLPEFPGEFDPLKVRYGNTKDQVKRDAKLQDEQQKHEFALSTWESDCQLAKVAAWNKFLEEATLHAETSRVCAIGYGLVLGNDIDLFLDISEDESSLLKRWWFFVHAVKKNAGSLVSFNGNRFDLPILTKRSWVHDLDMIYLRTKYGKWDDISEDALERWKLGGGWNESVKLDTLAKILGEHRKLEGVTGDMFHVLLKEDPEKARRYLASDILALGGVAAKMRMF